MTTPTQPIEPFHEGERAIQTLAGVRERISEVGQRVIRTFMPDQHRQFFTQLPFLMVGTLDSAGQPWTSVLAGPPGFVTSPEPELLVIRALPQANDMLAQTLVPGVLVGLLGIEPHTRRRNRMNGLVEQIDATGFSVRVVQSFGNCPQYIQAREPEFVSNGASQEQTLHCAEELDAAAMSLIQRADTFYIASTHPAARSFDSSTPATAERSQGVDVSHRGGKPGFVRVDSPSVLTVPDFPGNLFFNTLGNLVVEPRAGLLFIDFTSGDLLQVSVHCEVIWEGLELNNFRGAERLLRLTVTGMRRMSAALPLRWGPPKFSSVLAFTGAWD